MKEIKECVMCGNSYESYISGHGKRGQKARAIRTSHAVTCSTPCSRRYQSVYGKIYRRFYSEARRKEEKKNHNTKNKSI